MNEVKTEPETQHPLQKLQSDVLELKAKVASLEARLIAISEALEKRLEHLPR